MNEAQVSQQLGVLSSARNDAIRELDHRTGALRDAVQEAADNGMAEAAIARAALVTRATVRDWLGKPRRGDHVTAIGYHCEEQVTGPYRPRTDFPGAMPPADAAWIGADDSDGAIMVKAATIRVVSR